MRRGVNKAANHRSEKNKWCTFKGKSTDEINILKDKYFVEHPDAKVEYEKLCSTLTGKSKKERNEQWDKYFIELATGTGADCEEAGTIKFYLHLCRHYCCRQL